MYIEFLVSNTLLHVFWIQIYFRVKGQRNKISLCINILCHRDTPPPPHPHPQSSICVVVNSYMATDFLFCAHIFGFLPFMYVMYLPGCFTCVLFGSLCRGVLVPFLRVFIFHNGIRSRNYTPSARLQIQEHIKWNAFIWCTTSRSIISEIFLV